MPGSEHLKVIVEPGMLDGEEIIFAKKGFVVFLEHLKSMRSLKNFLTSNIIVGLCKSSQGSVF